MTHLLQLNAVPEADCHTMVCMESIEGGESPNDISTRQLDLSGTLSDCDMVEQYPIAKYSTNTRAAQCRIVSLGNLAGARQTTPVVATAVPSNPLLSSKRSVNSDATQDDTSDDLEASLRYAERAIQEASAISIKTGYKRSKVRWNPPDPYGFTSNVNFASHQTPFDRP
mmetsp:Transcript_31048/g.81219  ORF Transcript_31048/g.81219 Transcript_31048/m.81219 type:complete len:169 (+) Transcript_31048:486-992(+)